jgi:hypothetical protein
VKLENGQLDDCAHGWNDTAMTATLDAHTAGGRLTISFPAEAMPAGERDEFVAFLKSEWIARQSRLSATEATRLAGETDSDWWQRNNARLLHRITEAQS